MTPAHFLIGLGAGAASALLYAAAATGSAVALMLIYIAPLPILIAGVGWGRHAGLLGAAAGAVSLALIFGAKAGVYFLIVAGLPAWWLANLAMLGRPGATEGETEWYPVGRLVVWCAALGAALIAATIPLVATDLESYRAALRAVFTEVFAQVLAGTGGAATLPGGQDPKQIVDFLTAVAPGVAATSWTLVTLANLYLAARICRALGRLSRPWPDIPSMELPRGAALGLLAGFGGSLLPGLLSVAAELVAATFLFAFMLLGLAVMHMATRGVPARGLILVALYALTLQPLAGVFLAGLGLSEQLFGLRRRLAARRGGPPATP